MATAFYTLFDAVVAGNTSGVPPLVTLNYRLGEALYLKTDSDRVTCIFSISFKDQDDLALSKVFLKVSNALQRATTCYNVALHSADRPLF